MGLREEAERLNRAGEMPHRKLAGDNPLDAHLSTEIGRLYFRGYIDQAEYEAGMGYASLALLYLESIDAPAPYGGDLASIEDDVCKRRNIKFAAARKTLRDVGGRCLRAVDRVAVYDEPPRNDLERHALRVGLRALCG